MKENQLPECRQAEGCVSIWTPCRAPAEARQIKFHAALNVERVQSTRRVMGLFEAWHRETVEVELVPGNTLLLHTDGTPKQRTLKSLASPACWTLLRAMLTCRRDPFSKQWSGQSSNSARLANNGMTSQS